MEVLNKLKNAVSSALPGNPLSKDFEVYGLIATAGPGHFWKIYNATKRTTKQDAAVFVFEKKTLDKYSKRDREFIIEALKKGASQLTRLRHPKILSVIQPLEESRETLAFATEPVFASLYNLLGNNEYLPEPVAKQITDHKMFEMEIKFGLLQLTEGLQFLHTGVKLLHNNLCPDSIIVNKSGSWKLAGFDFCVPNSNAADQSPMFAFRPWEIDVHAYAQPCLDYLAPEYVLTESCSLASDMFSMGVLIYAMFNSGKPLYDCSNQLSVFRKNAEEMRKWHGSLLGKLPEGLQDIVKLLLNPEPTVRPDPDQLAKIHFFEDVGCMTLQYMDSLFQQDNMQKSKFFKGLPKIIVKFPKRVNLQRILPSLLKECVNPDMVPFVLPNILQIADQASEPEYVSLILPDLLPLFKLTSPIQILLLFMQNMSLLLKKTPSADIKTHVMPMIHRALESDTPQIQDLCLEIVPTFADLVDYTALKNSIVPRIKKLCLGTSTIGVRVNCLLCLGKLLETMDRWYVLDEVLPLLPQIPSREPAVLMSILGIYKVAFSHSKLGITKDMLAGKVIPFLVSVSIDNNLNLAQFKAYISLVKEMVQKVETEHHSKLEQLEQMKQEQRSLEITKIANSDDKTLIGKMEDDRPKSMMDEYLSGVGESRLSVGGKLSATSPASSPSKQAASQAPKTLSLEEKQKLAKQQEQQRMMKATKPLEAKSSLGKTGTLSQGPKDLTSSLLQSNLSNTPTKQTLNSSLSGNPVSAFSSSSMNSASPFLSSNSLTSSSQSGFNTNASTGNLGQQKKVDLSSFDTLLSNGSPKPKNSMNEFAQIRTSTPNSGSLLGRGMGNGPNMMGTNQGMMGTNQGMVGINQGMMGTNQNMIGTNRGMMGTNQGMIGNMSMNASGMMGNQHFPSQQSMMGQSMQTGNMTPGFGGQQLVSGGYPQPMNSGFGHGGSGFQGQMFQTPGIGGQMMQPQSMTGQSLMSNTSSTSRSSLDDLLG